jgi:hypothetical protein
VLPDQGCAVLVVDDALFDGAPEFMQSSFVEGFFSDGKNPWAVRIIT